VLALPALLIATGLCATAQPGATGREPADRVGALADGDAQPRDCRARVLSDPHGRLPAAVENRCKGICLRALPEMRALVARNASLERMLDQEAHVAARRQTISRTAIALAEQSGRLPTDERASRIQCVAAPTADSRRPSRAYGRLIETSVLSRASGAGRQAGSGHRPGHGSRRPRDRRAQPHQEVLLDHGLSPPPATARQHWATRAAVRVAAGC
jgi:hypothetical protein